ncbi:MAG: histidine kinase, partial [Bacteroidetes bacterium]|nr:histidine kinase [Bacteroidota bacterium]
LAEDREGMIWIGTGKGIFKYDPFRESLISLDVAPGAYISHLVVDQQNNLWFLANYSLCKYDHEKNKVENLKIQASCLAIDRMKLWIGHDTGSVGAYDIATGTIINMKPVCNQGPGNSRSISKIYPINDHELLIGCFKQGLKSYNVSTGLVQSLQLGNNIKTDFYVRDITAGGQQQYWIATESGIYIYDMALNKSQHLRKKAGDPYSLADNAVYTICKDNQDGMWVGTYFGGINYYSKENARFEKYFPLQGANSISGDAIGTICPDTYGNLWIGTEDAGLNKLNLKTGKFTNYTATGKNGDISYPNIHGLLVQGNQLFIGPFLRGMEIMDIRTGRVTDHFRFVGNQHDRLSDFIQRIYLTKDSMLLVGTAYRGSGLFSFDPKLKTFSRIPQIPYNSYVFDIAEDHEGTIWTGSVSQGVFYYNPRTGKHGNLRFGNTEENQVINEFPVHNILEDSEHALWFATSGGGLVKLSPDRKAIKKFTLEKGFPSNLIYCMLEDGARHLWISSLDGLICFDMATEQSRVYTQANGLITNQFNY